MNEIQERATKALAREALTQQGPWRVEEGDVLAPDDVDCPRGCNPTNRVAECGSGADAEFIAHAKSDVPALANAVLALSEKLQALEVALKDTLPKCSCCRALATRSYYHCAGPQCYVCDNDKCMDEDFCDECGQVWYSDNDKCNATKDGGIPCTGTSKHPENHASYIRDLLHAAVIRSLP